MTALETQVRAIPPGIWAIDRGQKPAVTLLHYMGETAEDVLSSTDITNNEIKLGLRQSH